MNDRPARLHVGMATVVTVFAVLALTIFSVLTLVSAHSEYELAEISAETVQSYYEAEATLTDRVRLLCESLSPEVEATDYVLAEPIDHARTEQRSALGAWKTRSNGHRRRKSAFGSINSARKEFYP